MSSRAAQRTFIGVAGRGDHRIWLDPASVGQNDFAALEAVDRSDDLDRFLLEGFHEAVVDDGTHTSAVSNRSWVTTRRAMRQRWRESATQPM
jgi:hypothetical protein